MQSDDILYGIPLDGLVSTDAIEEALVASWRQATAPGGLPPARASVLTLVVCVAQPWSAEHVIKVVDRLAEHHPSRTLVLVPDLAPAEDHLQAWYTTGCVLPEGAEQPLCSEQIVIRARGHTPRHLPSLADQLILPDLTAFLWWTGDLSFTVETLFDRLVGLSDRIIVDSASFRSLGPATVRLRRLARRHPSGSVSDLSWARLTPWREFLSQFFDSPTFRARLSVVDNVAIEYAPNGSDGPAQALLLLGWLGACLGWTPDSDTVPVEWPAHGRFRRPDGKFVEFTAAPEGGEAAEGLREVILRAGTTASFRVTRDDDRRNALTEAIVDGGPPIQRIARFESSEVSGLLARELMLFGRDHAYESALAVAVTLAGGATQGAAR